MQSYSLFELNEYLRRVIALNFGEPIWINAEIAQVNQVKGNIYLEFIEQDDNDQVVAQLSGAIWYKQFLFLKAKLGELLPSLLTAGMHIKVKVMLEFNERYGLKLIVEDIDASYTLGKLELARQKIIERLKNEGVFHINKTKQLPRVIQRIAIISSSTAAGYADFEKHMSQNTHGYQFHMTLFQAAMQGANTEREVSAALDDIKKNYEEFDIIIIIRGGGSKLDLSGFDNFNIGYKIAQHHLPVLTGIGHEIDQSIADLVAHTNLKTPTAVANFIIDHNLFFESTVLDQYNKIVLAVDYTLKEQANYLQIFSQDIALLPQRHLHRANTDLLSLGEQKKFNVQRKFEQHKAKLDAIAQLLVAKDPQELLKKGFTYIKQKEQYIKSKNGLTNDQPLEIHFIDGIIRAQTIN